LNLPAVARDQRLVPFPDGDLGWNFGDVSMESVRPDNADPIPLQRSQHNVGSIMIRFVGLLLIFVVVMGLLWSR
jgi:hypothetical protein